MSSYTAFSNIFTATENSPLLSWNRPVSSSLSPEDYSLFLRVCQSAWSCISDEVVMGIRLALGIYLTTVLAVDIKYQVFDEERGILVFFVFSNGSLVTQLVYYWLSFVWTYMYTLAPREARKFLRQDMENDFIRNRLNSVVNVPNSTPRKQLAFSLFYTSAVTFPLVSAAGFCAALVIKDFAERRGPGNQFESLADGRLEVFVLVNRYCICAGIALIEIIFLNTVRRQQPFSTHVLAVIVLCLAYFVWTYIGHLITGKFVYKYLDPAEDGQLGVAIAMVSITLISVCMFSFQYGLHGLRQRLSSKHTTRRPPADVDDEVVSVSRPPVNCELIAWRELLLLMLCTAVLGILYITIAGGTR